METRELPGIPDYFTVDHIVPLGCPHEKEAARAAALARARELGPRRRSLERIVCRERYDMTKIRCNEAVIECIRSQAVTGVARASNLSRDEASGGCYHP